MRRDSSLTATPLRRIATRRHRRLLTKQGLPSDLQRRPPIALRPIAEKSSTAAGLHRHSAKHHTTATTSQDDRGHTTTTLAGRGPARPRSGHPEKPPT